MFLYWLVLSVNVKKNKKPPKKQHNMKRSEKKTEDEKPLGKVIYNHLTITASFK